MSTGKKKKTKFTFQSLIRLIIFSIIIFFLINLISTQKFNSSQKLDPTISIDEKTKSSILGKTTEISNKIYKSIPESSRNQLENLEENQAVLFIQNKINYIKEQSQGFPQNQIKEIQKMVIKNIYENTIKNIESQ